jgi:hypothetical protein
VIREHEGGPDIPSRLTLLASAEGTKILATGVAGTSTGTVRGDIAEWRKDLKCPRLSRPSKGEPAIVARFSPVGKENQSRAKRSQSMIPVTLRSRSPVAD